MGAEDFFVSAANGRAHDMVMASHNWPDGKLALIGPEGAGKSHLARVWAEASGATIRQACTLLEPIAPVVPGDRLCIEDVDRLPREAEEALFHLHNNLLGSGGRLLLTARVAPARWSVALPDLASRMTATTVVTIEDPDDDLLRAVLTKLFADRQLTPEPKLVQWLLPRMERSFAAAARIVAEIDRRALAEGRVINASLAREILDTHQNTGE